MGEHAKMEIKSPLGVEEWAFVQSALENGGPEDLQFESTHSGHFEARDEQLQDDDQVMLIENKRLKMEIVAKQQAGEETAARMAELEKKNQQLYKMWKDQVNKRTNLEKKIQHLDAARTKQLKECKRLRKICLHQAVTLISTRYKVLEQDQKYLSGVFEQVAMMEQWLMMDLKDEWKRCRPTEQEDIIPVSGLKRLKKSTLKAEAKKQMEPVHEWKATASEVLNIKQEYTTGSGREFRSLDAERSAEIHYFASPGMHERFDLLDAEHDEDAAQLQLDSNEMLMELNVNFDWQLDRPSAD